MLTLPLKKSFSPRAILLCLMLIPFLGCNTTNDSDFGEAEILSFEIIELPSASFSIDNTTGLIFISEASTSEELSLEDLASLSAVFTVSEGASAFVGDSLQESGVMKNDFSNGLTYTIVSEDGMKIKEYFVYLTQSIPKSYLLEGEIGIQVNPSGIAPLSAKATIIAKKEINSSFVILGDHEIADTNPEFSKTHQLGIHGLYPNSSNRVAFSLVDRNNVAVYDTVTIQTGSLPDFFPDINIDVLNENQMEPGMHFSGFSVGNSGAFNSYPFIYDNHGKIRWFLDLSGYSNLAWATKFIDKNTLFTAVRDGILELDLFGNLINKYAAPGYTFHHDVIRLPNGNYVAAVVKLSVTILKDGSEIESYDDHVIEIDVNTNTVVTEWDLADILDVDRVDLVDGGGDWLHMNAIWYDEDDEALIISGRNQGLIKVNWENELQWILSPHQGWGLAGRTGEGTDTTPYLLQAVDQTGALLADEIQLGTQESDLFSWSWGQHTPMILPNGNLFVFDNGTNRNFGSASQYSQASEYKINEQNMTAELVWSYGKNRGNETFSNIISDVDLLPTTQNRLFSPGFITGPQNKAKVIEITYPDKEIVFESTTTFKNLLGSGQGWGQIDITYRTERVSLY